MRFNEVPDQNYFLKNLCQIRNRTKITTTIMPAVITRVIAIIIIELMFDLNSLKFIEEFWSDFNH